jgi:succinoglycan biosynthesis transport protein ExoP
MELPKYSDTSRALDRASLNPPAPAPPAIIVSEADLEDITLPLTHYVWILRRHLWNILGFVAVCVFGAAAISMRITPIYESTATLYVDRQEAKGVVGQESQSGNYSTADAEQFLASQVKLIQEDSVVRPVAEKYKLLEKEKQIANPNDAPLALDAPIVLRNLKVVRPPNTFLLQISYRSSDRQLASDVANAIAVSYIEHTYNIRIRSSASLSKFMERQIDELRTKMEASTGRLAQLEREMNVINPEEKTNILSARLLQLNTEYTKAQAERVRLESAFQSTRGGAIEAAQVSSQGEALKRLTEKLDEAKEQFTEVRQEYGVNHPEYRKAQAKLREIQSQVDAARQNILRRVEVEYDQAVSSENMLRQQVAETKAEYDRLNLRSFEYQRAKREAEADKLLYEELVRKIREAGINAGFQNNTVRLANPARPAWHSVYPKILLNVVLAFLFSSVLAIGAAILVDALDNTIRDPDQAMRTLNTRIVGTIPAVRNSSELRIQPDYDQAGPHPPGNRPAPADRQLTTYDEAVRTVRSQVFLTDFDRRLKTLLFTSATAGEGKSTTASHLACAHAEQKHRTLLIDCDLRRPSQHKVFSVPMGYGLSNVLTGEMAWREVLNYPVDNPFLSVITAGPPSRRAADLIGSMLIPILDEMTQCYDLVVLDAPPLLGFAESLQLASIADGVIVVTHAGETNRKAVSAAIATLNQLRANVVGLVLNRVKRHHSDQYYYYGYYGKYYKHYQNQNDGAERSNKEGKRAG